MAACFPRCREPCTRVEKGSLTLLGSPSVSFGLGRLDGIEESGGESFVVTPTAIQVSGLKVIVESVGRVGARVIRVVREKG